jgi:hypothetical protein
VAVAGRCATCCASPLSVLAAVVESRVPDPARLPLLLSVEGRGALLSFVGTAPRDAVFSSSMAPRNPSKERVLPSLHSQHLYPGLGKPGHWDAVPPVALHLHLVLPFPPATQASSAIAFTHALSQSAFPEPQLCVQTLSPRQLQH